MTPAAPETRIPAPPPAPRDTAALRMALRLDAQARRRAFEAAWRDWLDRWIDATTPAAPRDRAPAVS